MHRFLVVLWLVLIPVGLAAQHTSSDLKAVALAQQSMSALAGKLSVVDVTLQAEVNSMLGPDTESGAGTFWAKGPIQSRVDLHLGGDTQSEIRNSDGCALQSLGGAAKAHDRNNCVTDAAWFFPALSSLSQTASSQYEFNYLGEEEYASVNTQHIRVSRVFPQDASGVLQRLSVMDFYLDIASNLPVSITFQTHPDNDLNVNIITEVRFSDYRAVNGIQVPFSFQKMLNGRVVLEGKITSVEIDASLPDSIFALQ